MVSEPNTNMVKGMHMGEVQQSQWVIHYVLTAYGGLASASLSFAQRQWHFPQGFVVSLGAKDNCILALVVASVRPYS